MKRLIQAIFSISFMGGLLLAFALSMAVATFIENDFGTPVAQKLIYNSWWFEAIMVLLIINLVANIFQYKLYLRKKWSLLLFHTAFILIFLGAAVTRYISFEGILHLRENETKNYILSDKPIVKIKTNKDSIEIHNQFTAYTFKKFTQDLKNQGVKIIFEKFIPNAQETLVPAEVGDAFVQVAVFESGKMQHYWLQENKSQILKNKIFAIDNSDKTKADIHIKKQNDTLYIQAYSNGILKEMQTGNTDTLIEGNWYQIEKNKLYQFTDIRFVITDWILSAQKRLISTDMKHKANSINALQGKIIKGEKSIAFTLKSNGSDLAEVQTFNINGTSIQLSYGLKKIKLPFKIKLKKFELKRYPGSGSPSSYSSIVEVFDKQNKKNFEYKIYMNHVLDYRGYRFFQSSYDLDEKGSILSVNHDAWGTGLTYLGYLLMALGMLWSLANINGRFRKLINTNKKLHQTRTISLLILFMFMANLSFAQQHKVIPQEQAHEFGKLFIQDNSGRVKTINVFASEILRKMSRKTTWEGLSPEQVFLGIIVNSDYWTKVPLIRISDKKVQEYLGIKKKYVSFSDVVDLQTGEYRLKSVVNKAYSKSPAQRDMFDKAVIKADERINIFYLAFVGQFLHIFPNPDHSQELWHIPGDTKFQTKDTLYKAFVKDIFAHYYKTVKEAEITNNWQKADSILTMIKTVQQKYGKSVIPSDQKVRAEEFYTRTAIFERLFPLYGTVGFILITLLFLQIFNPKWKFKIPIQLLVVLIMVFFAFHTLGLGLRWYISGHAPWSDGYEAMVYISWVLVLAGLIFTKNSKMGLAATTLLSSIMLLVAHLNWMDPTITNLVPVLKSYWLSIHVSVITASYGFLGLSALLGFLVLILMALQTPNNYHKLKFSIKELSQVNEISLIVGLYLLTIGTFLGGVWANESWGRYWGWDPKETWALISVVIYSFVAHIRLIPGLKGYFPLNLSAAWSYWVIMMTFFGVNFYLSGMHSYAKGDPVPIPSFVYIIAGVMLIVSILAYWKNKQLKITEQ